MSIDITDLRAHRAASSPWGKTGKVVACSAARQGIVQRCPRGGGRRAARTRSWMPSPPSRGLKVDDCRAVDAIECPTRLFVTPAEVGDHGGARALLRRPPATHVLLCDRLGIGSAKRCRREHPAVHPLAQVMRQTGRIQHAPLRETAPLVTILRAELPGSARNHVRASPGLGAHGPAQRQCRGRVPHCPCPRHSGNLALLAVGLELEKVSRPACLSQTVHTARSRRSADI